MPNWLAYLIWIVMHAYVITTWWVKKNIFLLLLQSMSAGVKRVFLTGHQHPQCCIWRDVRSFKGRPLCIKLRCTFVLFLCASGNRSKFSPKIKKATKDRPFKRIKKRSFFSFLSNEVSSEKARSFLDYKTWLAGFVLRRASHIPEVDRETFGIQFSYSMHILTHLIVTILKQSIFYIVWYLRN